MFYINTVGSKENQNIIHKHKQNRNHLDIDNCIQTHTQTLQVETHTQEKIQAYDPIY